MQLRMMQLFGDWKNILLMIGIVLLAGCKAETRGSVELRDGAGQPYSFAGATATLYPLNPSAVMPGQAKVPLATGTVAADDGAVTLSANRYVVHEGQLYVVEFICPANIPDDGCEVAMPLRVVLTKAELKAGGWRATALTEAAFHAVAYGAAARFSTADMKQVLDDTAQALLGLSYQGLLLWNPNDTAALHRPDQLASISTALVAGIDNNTLKRLVQRWINPGSVAWQPPSPAFALDLVVANSYVFLLSNGLDILDVRDPQAPVRVSTLGFNRLELGRDLERQGDLIYVATVDRASSRGALRIIDVSDPLHPIQMGSLPLEGEASSVAVDGDYAYLTENPLRTPGDLSAVHVVDIRNPQQPVIVASMEFPPNQGHVVKSGPHLFVSGSVGLNIVDVSNPVAPLLTGALSRRYGGALAVAGDYVFLRHGDATLDVVDVSNLAAPILAATLDLDWTDSDSTFGPIESILIDGNYAYLAFGGQGLHRIDISDPTVPRWTGSLDNPEGISSAVALSGGLAYVASGSAGLRILDTHILHRTPALVASVDLPGRLNAQTVANPFAIYSPIPGFGISIIDLWPQGAPELATTYTSWTQQVSLVGRYAYLANFEEFQVLDIFNPFAPIALPGTIKMNERGFRYLIALDVADDYAYVTAASEGSNDAGRLVVIDIQDPQTPILSAQLNLSSMPSEVIVNGDWGYVVVADTQLQIVDLQNPLLPLLAGNFNLPCAAMFLAAAEDHLYVACGTGGVQILDVSDPATPALAATIDTVGSANAITLDGKLAYIADTVSGIVLVDVADPAAPIIICNAAVRGSARGVLVQNGLVYASASAGLDVLKKPRAVISSD